MTTKKLLSYVATLVVAGFARPTIAANAPLRPNDTLAICGDSITEQKIYSTYIEEYILACQPTSGIRTMQFGWSGDTTLGFLGNKLDNDVLRFHPTVATTNFGMNDGGYSKLSDAVAERYRKSTQEIIDKLKAGGVHTIIVGSPGCVGDEPAGKPAKADVYNQTLKSLRDIDAQLAGKNGVIFADVFTPMLEAKNKAREKFGADFKTNGNDGIHPGPNGHLIMAYAYLKAMGFDGNIGTITVDLGANTATATDGHKIADNKVTDGSVDIDSTRYPFCFSGPALDPNSNASEVEFFPFNQDLNRLTLIVKNAPADNFKITWGSATKQFTKSELETGINLAAEFLDNPFSAAFKKLSDAVSAQQGFETPFIKGFVVSVPGMEKVFGDEELPTFDHLLIVGAAKDKMLFSQAAGALVPVHHTIRIEAVK